MSRLPPLTRLVSCALLSCLLATPALARSFHVEDANGKPLEDAVIVLPGAPDAKADTPAIMDQVDNRFVPYVLVIQRGQRVSFPNSDHRRHHVYSFSPVKPFEIKLYSGNTAEPVLFDKAGIVALGCNIHDSMVAYIVVADSALAGKTDAQGNLQLADGPAPATVQVWHPSLNATAPALVTLPLPAAGADGVHRIQLQAGVPAQPPKRTLFDNRHRHGS